MTVNRADETAYGDLPASRLVTLFWYTIHAYPPGHVTAYRTCFGPYRILRIDGSRIYVRCSPRLGGELLCAPKQLRHYHSPDDLS